MKMLCLLVAASLWTGVLAAQVAPPPTSSEAAPLAGQSARVERASGHLPFHYDLYTFRGTGGTTTVVAAVAVPVKELRSERVDGRIQYRFDMNLVLADTTARSVVTTLDSVVVYSAAPLSRHHLLHTFIEVEARPSRGTLQRVIVTDAANPGRGQLYTGPFRIRDYSGDHLMISDIAMGLPEPSGGWRRPGAPLALLPTTEFPESSFDVYYEIYNLPNGTPYETEIAIQRLDDDDEEHRPIRTSFTGEAESGEDGTAQELRLVESALPKGRYRLTVTVTNMANGQEAARSQVVEVTGSRSGTTLVRALPWRGN